MKITKQKVYPDSEKAVDAKLGRRVKAEKGLYIKLGTTIFSGLPDRLILLPKGRVRFVELKSKGKDPTKLQSVILASLKRLGFLTYVLRGGDPLEVEDYIIEGINED